MADREAGSEERWMAEGKPGSDVAHALAEAVADSWEAVEGETFREAHRETLVRLIAEKILEAQQETAPLLARIAELEQALGLIACHDEADPWSVGVAKAALHSEIARLQAQEP